MRDIQFRGKRLDNGKWETGNFALIEGNPYIIPYFLKWNEAYKSEIPEYVKVDPETVGQYTDLNDKNNEPLYEGDIVCEKEFNECGYIFFDVYHGFAFCWPTEPYWRKDAWYWARTVEKVGNIHDNPELMEVEP